LDITVRVPSGPAGVVVVGSGERHLKMIRETLGVNIAARDGWVRIQGDPAPVSAAKAVLDELSRDVGQRGAPSRQRVLELIAEQAASAARAVSTGVPASGPEAFTPWDGRLDVYVRGRAVRPMTVNQQAYLEAVRDHDLTIAIGPAGTGKTYLAVAAAVHLLKTGRVTRLILARPAVEAGEKLGFLPGGLEAKVNPFLRPLFDALNDMMEFAHIRRFMESDVIEVVPLAYMRGRTLNNAMIICDEAQNTTRGQMKMFLTRMGHGSKMVVTGDVTQIDLPEPLESGLIDAARRLRRVSGVATVTLESADVVRHSLVQKIIDAYGETDREAMQRDLLQRAMSEADSTGGDPGPGASPG
jgi:phosphate starvation-inducible protein PhoH and related proteins